MAEQGEETRRAQALVELDGLLALAELEALGARSCRRLVELVAMAPGRTRRVVSRLSSQRDAAAVDALLALPPATSGVVEGLFRALRAGVRRCFADRWAPHMLALEFPTSTSKRFPVVRERAIAGFGAGLERLEVAGKLRYRVAVFPARVGVDAGSAGARRRLAAWAFELEGLLRDLRRLRGVRLWLNGWRFDDDAPVAATARLALMRAWFEWAQAEGQP